VKWKRTNGEKPVHENQDGNFYYKITRARRGLYEVFLKCTEGAVGVDGTAFPAHFEWYYLTNFKNAKDARSFVEGYDSGKIKLSQYEREPYES